MNTINCAIQTSWVDIVTLLIGFCTLICNIFLARGVWIAKKNYEESCVANKNNIDIVRISKAIDLADYYKKNILFYLPIIRTKYINSGIKQILDGYNNKEIKYFTKKGLDEFYSKSDLDMIKSISNSQIFAQAVKYVDDLYDLKLDLKPIKDDKGNMSYDVKFVNSVYTNDIVCATMNNMEYFAMFFSSNVAAESSVFDSLHQTYIELVELLYYDISKNNESGCIPYYQRLSELYTIWKKRQVNQLNNMVDEKKLYSIEKIS